jgi:hypothetical protein
LEPRIVVLAEGVKERLMFGEGPGALGHGLSPQGLIDFH